MLQLKRTTVPTASSGSIRSLPNGTKRLPSSKWSPIVAAMGLSAADAVLLYHRIVAEQAFPLELKVPNGVTRAAMDEADDIIAKRAVRHNDGAAMIDSLNG